MANGKENGNYCNGISSIHQGLEVSDEGLASRGPTVDTRNPA